MEVILHVKSKIEAYLGRELDFSKIREKLPEIRSTIIANRKYFLIPAVALVGYCALSESGKDLRDKLFVYVYYKFILKNVNQTLQSHRQIMRAELTSIVAQKQDTNPAGILRILEIGIRSGSNLDFYPASCQVIGVESNPYFLEGLLKLQQTSPMLVKVIRGYPEDLSEVRNGSVDVVVSTLAMYKVKDGEKCIKEIRRVLVKGGRFYFFEYQPCRCPWSKYLWRFVLNPPWKVLLDVCTECRTVLNHMAANRFEISHARLGTKRLLYIPQSIAEGYAVKE